MLSATSYLLGAAELALLVVAAVSAVAGCAPAFCPASRGPGVARHRRARDRASCSEPPSCSAPSAPSSRFPTCWQSLAVGPGLALRASSQAGAAPRRPRHPTRACRCARRLAIAGCRDRPLLRRRATAPQYRDDRLRHHLVPRPLRRRLRAERRPSTFTSSRRSSSPGSTRRTRSCFTGSASSPSPRPALAAAQPRLARRLPARGLVHWSSVGSAPVSLAGAALVLGSGAFADQAGRRETTSSRSSSSSPRSRSCQRRGPADALPAAASPAGRGGALALAGLSIGLAAGTKLNYLAPRSPWSSPWR